MSRRIRLMARGLVVGLGAAAVALTAGPALAAAGGSGWAQRPPLTHARPGLDVATVDGTIFAIGGFDPNSSQANNAVAFVETRLTAGAGTWHDIAPLPTARSNAQVAVLNGRVYVAGGAAGPSDLDQLDIYDPSTGSWTSGTKLPQTRSAGAAAALNGRIYVAGGAVDGGSSPSGSVIRYDPSAGSWTNVAPMHQPRYFLRMVPVQGHLYAIGGNNGSKTVPTVERYDPTSDTWTTVASMNQDRGVPGAVAINDRCIVVVGGSHIPGPPSGHFLRSTEVYSVARDKWQMLAVQLPQARTSLVSALEANGDVLTIGGEVANGPSALVEALTLPAGSCPP
jgi:N-acetylneuraminic acid mutarotase